MNKLHTVEVIENLAIQYLDELKVEHSGPVVIESYEDEDGLYYTVLFDIDASFERADELYWDFVGFLTFKDLATGYISVNFIGKSDERIKDDTR